MGLIGVYGKGGSGKNIIVMYLLVRYFPNIKKYLNFDTELPNAKKIDSIKLFEIDFNVNDIIIVVWDEAYTEMEDRNFMSDTNRINSYLLFQARKNNMTIISISQLDILDIRWDRLEDITILCRDRPIFDKNLNDYKGDFYYYISNRRKVMPFKLSYRTAKKLFPLYDTRQKILPKDFEIMKNKMLMKNPKERNKTIDKIVEEIKRKTDIPEEKKDITHNWLKNTMLDLEMPNLALEPYVYLRLRKKSKDV